jgi:hypothetical protein
MVESECILLGTDRDADGIPWALLASDRDSELEFLGSAILTRSGRTGGTGAS